VSVIERFRREFAHDDWANREVLSALRALLDPPEGCVRWLAHVAGAELLWLARLRGEPSPVAVWPSFTLAELGPRIDEARSQWRRLLDETDEHALASEIRYVNSKGEPWSSLVQDVLSHVLLHGAYHRGQIASALRAAGFEPPVTDFIHARRSGLVE
jgi:uncharacterized damage-inducible protein DinB